MAEQSLQFAGGMVHEATAKNGKPLAPSVQDEMEARFGYDFSTVRIHTDPLAALSARLVGARAYTLGRAVVFAEGQYRPRTDAGRRLLAHELAHVVQQRDGGESATSEDEGIRIAESAEIEAAAWAAARRVAAG